MAVDSGSPKTVAVVLECGSAVNVSKLSVEDGAKIIGFIRREAPDISLASFDEMTIGVAVMDFVSRLPGIIPEITACATGQTAEQTAKYTLRDSLEILKAMIRVNDIGDLIRGYRDFFTEMGEAVTAAFSNPDGSSQSKSSSPKPDSVPEQPS